MRNFDFLMAFLGILIFSPLFILIAMLIKLFSPGSIIFSQERVGYNGCLFRLYKFRSMVINSELIGTTVTTGKDTRITRIGKILRKTKLDELPQLWNVLKGDMSFIGPRPDVPEIVNNYDNEMKRILEVKPGITSNATLHLRNEEDLLSLAKYPDKAYEEIFVPAKVRLAMEHVNRKSFLFDFVILLRTIWALTGGKVWPIKEHPIIHEIKEKVEKMNNGINFGSYG